MARPDEIDATRSGTGVETLTPSLARSRPASAALISGTVANDTRERSSGYSTDTAACDHPSAKVFSTVRKSSTAGTIDDAPGQREAGLAVDLGAQPVVGVVLGAVDPDHGERHGGRGGILGADGRRVVDLEDLTLGPAPRLGVGGRDEHLARGLRAPTAGQLEVVADVVAGDQPQR